MSCDAAGNHCCELQQVIQKNVLKALRSFPPCRWTYAATQHRSSNNFWAAPYDGWHQNVQMTMSSTGWVKLCSRSNQYQVEWRFAENLLVVIKLDFPNCVRRDAYFVAIDTRWRGGLVVSERTVNERIEYKLLSLTYKVLTTSQPDYLHNLISVQSSVLR